MARLPDNARKLSERPAIGPLIRNLRRQQNRTLQHLGAAANLSVGFLSQIERQLATPSLGALAQIAHALGVEVEYFIVSPKNAGAFSRHGEREQYWVDSNSMIYERLTVDFPGSVLSSIIITLPPRFQSEAISHDGEEMVYQLEGTSQLTVDGETFTLEAGDSIHFRSSQRHHWANATDKVARVLWAGTAHIHRRMFKSSTHGAD